jgi:hypothetical protein
MNTPVDIEALHTAIKDALTEQFEDATVDFYSSPGERIASPSILFELEEILADDPDDIGTEQLAVRLRWNAYAVLSYKGANKLALRSLAASLMAFIRGKRWGQPVGAANVIGAFPDQIEGQPNDYEVMRIEFEHEALLGTDVWPGGELPLEVYLGIAPLIGPEHEEHYTRIDEVP